MMKDGSSASRGGVGAGRPSATSSPSFAGEANTKAALRTPSSNAAAVTKKRAESASSSVHPPKSKEAKLPNALSPSHGVCFPMLKGIYRVVHIPEDEAVLLNSREKAPYLICVEVLKGEVPSHSQAMSDTQKLSRGGIPLANGDAQLPKPPPWAYPLWNQRDIHHYDMLKSTSQAIDQVMAQLWEAKVKFVHASLSVEKPIVDPSKTNEDPESGYNSPFSVEGLNPSAANGADYLRINSDPKDEWVSVSLSAVRGVNMEDIDEPEPPRRKEHRRVPSTIAIEEVKAAAAKGQAPPGLPLKGAGQNLSDEQPKVLIGTHKPSDALSGELWEVKKERIRSSSVYGKSPGWDLRSMFP